MKKILFFGEIYPNSINGVSIANLTNLSFLEEKYIVDLIIEKKKINNHEKVSLNKISSILKQTFSIVKKSLNNRYDYFYLVFSLSVFGGIKTLFAIIGFKLFNKGSVVLQIHRGDFFLRFYTNKVSKLIANIVFKLTNKLIVLSDNQKTEMCIFKNLNIEVLYNTVDYEFAQRKGKILNTKFIYISNYLLEKGIIDLLEVFKELNVQYTNIYLETFGAFADEDFKKTVLSYSDSNIKINDVIQGEEKSIKISSNDCLILPSWNEGQPLVILEAMSLGLPIITTKVGLIPELLGEDYVYLANPRDMPSLKEKIIEFINSNENDLIAIQLKEKYDKYYGREKHKNRLFEIFD